MAQAKRKRTPAAKKPQANPGQLPARVPDVVGRVQHWIVRGLSEEQILASIAREWPGKSAQPLIVAAMARVADASIVDRQTLLGWCLQATRAVYQDALDSAHYADALRAIRQLHELSAEATSPEEAAAAPPAPA